MVSLGLYFFSSRVAAESYKGVHFATGFEIGDAIANHHHASWVQFGFELGDDFRFATIAGGWGRMVVACVGAVRIKFEGHGIDSIDPEMSGERFDYLGKSTGDDGDRPAIVAKLLQGCAGSGFDLVDIKCADLFAEVCGGLDEIESASKYLIDCYLTIHRGIGEGFDFLKGFGTSQSSKFINSLDAGQGGVAVEYNEFHGGGK